MTDRVTVKSITGVAGNQPAAFGLLLLESGVPGDFPLHGHDYYELELILAGEGTQWINGEVSPLVPGGVYLLGPADLHRLQVVTPLRLYNLKIAADRLPADLRTLLETCAGPVRTVLPPAAFHQMRLDLERLQTELRQPGPAAGLRLQSLLLLLLTDLLRATPASQTDRPVNPAFQRFGACLRHIRSHCREPLTLGAVAAAAGYTPNYLSHLFPTLAGCSFIDYVNRQRLQQAAGLLVAGDETIAAIAFACGFGSLAHFMRIFRRQYGLTPGQYRLQQRK